MEQTREIYESQKNKTLNNTAELQKVEEQFKMVMEKKEVAWSNEIHRLTHERDERNNALRLQEQERFATMRMLDESRDRVQTLRADVERLQEANSLMVEKLEKLTQLKQQLLQYTNALEDAKSETAMLRQENEDLDEKATTCRTERDQLRIQLDEKETVIDASRKQADSRAIQHEKNVQMLHELQIEVHSLRNASRILEQDLESCRSNEKEMDDSLQRHLEEKKRLRRQLDDAEHHLEAKENDIRRIQEDGKEEMHTKEEYHKTEIEKLEHRLEQAELAKNTAMADATRIGTESQNLIEEHKKKTNEKFELLVDQEVQRRLTQLNRVATKPTQLASQSSQPSSHVMVADDDPNALLSFHSGKARKIVTRQNNSVMTNLGASQLQSTSSEASDQQYGDAGDLDYFEETEGLGAREHLDENGVSIVHGPPDSIVDLPADVVPETQLTMSPRRFNEGLKHFSGSRQDLSSSSLSECPADMDDIELLDMTEMAHTSQGRSPLRNVTSLQHTNEVHSRGSDTRYDHPKSQANTGTRIMAPPPLPGSSLEYRTRKHDLPSRPENASLRGTSRSGRGARATSSSPDFMHNAGPSSSKTYSQRIGIVSGSMDRQPSNMPQGYGNTGHDMSSHKRKSSESQVENESPKRHRVNEPSNFSLSRTNQRDLPESTTRSTRDRNVISSQGTHQPDHNLRRPSAATPVNYSSHRSSSGRTRRTKGMNPVDPSSWLYVQS
ncbi:hypothetical protein P280DRAFT_301215 [Massarina eburnea CBS 473.64]|uniref:Uncharacterized protein n=1 Tax=Massarina eburnea CBS 473.64 TaxID=1395130 RepID=A0A6A6S0N7_9PLEO|nr:hypothetical protein P280DRAFT_301215 [Massarina eburnea CBS 473.64]